jgi:predicted dehydrogenase
VIRVGVIGAGSMGALHARVVRTCQATELAWVSDPNAVIGQAVAERFATIYQPEPDLDVVDAVIIATPTQHHQELGLAVMSCGLPLLMEKPLSQRLDEAVALVERAEGAGIPFACGFLERFNPAIRTALDIVDWPMHLRTVRHSPYVERIRTGVASDLLIHDADIAVRLFGGRPTSVAGHAGYFHPKSEPESEDVIEASLMFAEGQVASLSASRMSQRKVRELVITEADRLLEVDLLRQDLTIYRHISDSATSDEDGLGYRQQTIIDIPVVRHLGEPLLLQLEHFVDLINGDADIDLERNSLLAPHAVVADALATAPLSLDL